MIHIDNLPKLLEWGGDYAPNQCSARGLTKRTIHHAHIMDRRHSRSVPCEGGGNLADYIPFYFRKRSPMLYAIRGGQVEGYSGQKDILFLQSTAERVAGAGVEFAFTNGHAVIQYAEFFDRLSDLDQVPWDAVQTRYWNDIFDGKFKCQAEFLIKDFFDLDLVEKIGVYDEPMKEQVEGLFRRAGKSLLVTTEPEWYF
ncbi:MAG: DUF4433 domain-containing protein [Opitutales bacterium]